MSKRITNATNPRYLVGKLSVHGASMPASLRDVGAFMKARARAGVDGKAGWNADVESKLDTAIGHTEAALDFAADDDTKPTTNGKASSNGQHNGNGKASSNGQTSNKRKVTAEATK